jgi:hypothetical protein
VPTQTSTTIITSPHRNIQREFIGLIGSGITQLPTV